MVHGKQGDRNAVHALCRLYVLDLDVLTGGGKVQQRTAEADESTGDEHGGHDHTLGIDAEADAGVAVLAAGLQLEAEIRLLQQDVHDDGHNNNDEDADIRGAVREELLQAGRREAVSRRHGAGLVLHIVIDRGDLDEIVHKIHADVVHHDRRNDDIHAAIGVQQAGEQGPQGAADHAGQQWNDPSECSGEIPDAGSIDAAESAHDELAGAADVEDACLEAEADAKAGHDDRHGIIQHVAEGLHAAVEAARDERTEGRECIRGIRRQQNNEADEQTGQNGQDGGKHARVVSLAARSKGTCLIFHFTAPFLDRKFYHIHYSMDISRCQTVAYHLYKGKIETFKT